MIRKFLKYRVVIFQVLFYLIKFSFMKSFYSNNAFYQKVRNESKVKINPDLHLQKQPISSLICQIDRIIRIIYPKINCLILSLIKREVLALHGYKVQINLSIYKSNNEFRTHAWVFQPGMDSYKTLQRI